MGLMAWNGPATDWHRLLQPRVLTQQCKLSGGETAVGAVKAAAAGMARPCPTVRLCGVTI